MPPLPQVGAQAVLLGMTAFNANARSVTQQMAAMSRAAYYLERASSSAFRDIEKSTNQTLATVANQVKIVTGALVVLGTTAAVVGIKYADSVNYLGAVSEATSTQVNELSRAQLELSRHSRLTAEQLSIVSTELVKAGVDIADVTGDTLKAVNDMILASRGELKAADAAILAQVSMAAFGADVRTAVDAATAAVQRSTLTFTEYADALRQGGGVAAQFGLTVNKFAAVVGSMGKTLNTGSEIGAGFRVMLQRLQDPSKENTALINEYGVSLYDAQGGARDFVDILGDFERELGQAAITSGKLTRQERDRALASIFGARATKTIAALLDEGTEGYLKMLDATERLTAVDIANRVLEPTAAKAIMLKNNLVALGIAFGLGVDPFVNQLTSTMLKFAQSLDLDRVQAFGRAVGSMLYNALSFVGVVLSTVVVPNLEHLRQGFAAVGLAITEAFGTNPAVAALTSIGQLVGNLVSGIFPAFLAIVETLTQRLLSLARIIQDNILLLRIVVASVETSGRELKKLADDSIHALQNLYSTLASSPQFIAILRTGLAVLGVEAVLVSLRMLNAMRLTAAAAVVSALTTATAWIQTSARVTVAVGNMVIAVVAGTAVMVQRALLYAAVFGMTLGGLVIRTIGQVITSMGLMALSATVTAVRWAAAALLMGAVILTMGARSAAAAALSATSMFLIGAAATVASGSVVIGFGIAAVTALGAYGVRLLATSGLTLSAMAVMAAAAVRTAAVIAFQLGVVAVRGMAALSVAATVMATRVIIAFVAAMLPGVVAAIGAMLAAAAPFLLGIAAIGAAAALLAKGWADNWFDIQGIVGKAVAWILQKLNDFLDMLSQLPVIGDAIGGTRAVLGGFMSDIPGWTAKAGDAIGGFVKDTIDSFKAFRGMAMPDASEFTKQLEDARAEAERIRDEGLEAAKRTSGRVAGEPSEAGLFPGGGGGADKALKDLENATEKAYELLRDFNDDVVRETAKNASDIAGLYQDAFEAMGDAADKAAAEIVDALGDANNELLQMSRDRLIQDDAKARREGLARAIEEEGRARDEILKTHEIMHQRMLEDNERLADQARAQREKALDEQLEQAALVRRRLREDDDKKYQDGQEASRKALKDDQDIIAKALKDEQDLEAEALKKRQDREENALKKRQDRDEDALEAHYDNLQDSLDRESDARERALQDDQDARERALEAQQGLEKAAFKDAQKLAEIQRTDAADRAEAQAEYDAEVARGVKQSIAQTRLNEKLSKLDVALAEDKAGFAADQSEASAERVFDAQQDAAKLTQQATFEAESLALKTEFEAKSLAVRAEFENRALVLREKSEQDRTALRDQHEQARDTLAEQHETARDELAVHHEQGRITLAETLEKEALERSRTREEEDAKFRDEQEAARRGLKDKEDADALIAKRNQEDAERLRTKTLEDDARAYDTAQDTRVRELDRALDDEDYRRRVDNITSERDERITKAGEALAEEQRLTREKLAQDVLDLSANLDERISKIREQYLDRLEDLLRDGGEKMQPLVDKITDNIADGLRNIRDAAHEALEALAAVFGATGQVNAAAEARAGAAAATHVPSRQYGGMVTGGPYGSPRLVEAHVGEYYEGLGGQGVAMAAVRAAEAMAARGIGGSSSVTNNYAYNVNANYGQVQPAGSIARDLSALLALTRS